MTTTVTTACILTLTVTIGALAFVTPMVRAQADGEMEEMPFTRIAFGSCNKHDMPQPAWDHIIAEDPQLFVWLGDIVYGDTRKYPFVWEPSPIPEMKAKFDAQKRQPGYQRLLRQCPVVGIYDDHDYGMNDGGKQYADRRESQQLLLDFLDVPESSSLRQRDGVYTSYTFGPAGRRTKLILLDTRYHRDDLGDHGGDILGEQQWQWLRHELETSDAQLHLIGSGIQVVSDDKSGGEKWGNFPHARRRLFNLLCETQTSGAIFLSGDVHIAEMSVSAECTDMTGYPMVDFTSSGLTHSWGSHLAFGLGEFIISNILPHRHRVWIHPFENYGMINIDWESDGPHGAIVELVAHSAETGEIVHSYEVKLSEMQATSDCRVTGERLLKDPNQTCDLGGDPLAMESKFVIIGAITLLVLILLSVVWLLVKLVKCCCCSRRGGKTGTSGSRGSGTKKAKKE
eukprot:GFYU01003856.1.p1 GENE.GFYU01003856.1~~GFYU01003856.1.p1  ORF type:complete len:455 (-),score=86.03 GFYU01003856.1:95-1459(-)